MGVGWDWAKTEERPFGRSRCANCFVLQGFSRGFIKFLDYLKYLLIMIIAGKSLHPEPDGSGCCLLIQFNVFTAEIKQNRCRVADVDHTIDIAGNYFKSVLNDKFDLCYVTGELCKVRCRYFTVLIDIRSRESSDISDKLDLC